MTSLQQSIAPVLPFEAVTGAEADFDLCKQLSSQSVGDDNNE